MFIIKIVGKETKVFSADNFEIYGNFVVLHRTMVEESAKVVLDKDDEIYIMDAQGHTVDALSPPK